MSNQIVISSGAKVRSLEGVLTGSAGIVSSVPLGGANGVATLDSSGKVPLSQLPASVITYLGTWNAATNTPTLVNGTGDDGDLYICNVAGTVNFGAGPITFAVGDWVIYNGSQWQKSSGASGTVTSVAVTESGDALNITGSPITTAGTINIGFAGNSTQYINGEGNLVTFPTLITEAQTLITDVYNETGATLTKGTVVYINGGHGNLPTVTKALATSDATSAQTYGVVQADISNNNNGHVVVIGSLGDLDTQAYAAGTQLYLSSTTAGAWTSVKQYAPAHLVYVGIVVRSHPTQGVVEIKIQNGFELDELHNVSAQTPSNNDGLFYNSSNSLWENKSIATALGYTPANAATYVPYTGATSNVDLGSHNLTTTGDLFVGSVTGGGIFAETNVGGEGYIYLKGNGTFGILSIYNSIFANGYKYGFDVQGGTTGAAKRAYLDFGSLTNSTTRTYSFPDASGTLALTSDIPSLTGYVPYTGATTNVNLGGYNLTGYTLNGNQGLKVEGYGGEGGYLAFKQYAVNNLLGFGYTSISANSTNILSFLFAQSSPYDAKQFKLDVAGLTTNVWRTYTMPNADGTLALTSDIPSLTNYATLNTVQTFTAQKTFNADVFLNYGATIINADLGFQNSGFELGLNATTLTANRAVYLQDKAGTIALTSDLSSYLPLTGGTLTGALSVGTNLTVGNVLFGNSAQFSNSVTASAYFLNGMTAGSGALYWTSNRVTLANYNSGGSLAFEVNGGSTALTLASTGAATFSSSVTAAQGLFYVGTGVSAIHGKFGDTGTGWWQFSNAGATSDRNMLRYYNTSSTEIIRFDPAGSSFINGGNVGIGTSSPSSTRADKVLSLYGSYPGISLESTGVARKWDITANYSGGTAFLEFYDETASAARMVINASGNVGIGTSSPSTPLYVVGSMKSETGLYFNNATTNGAFVWQEANTPLRFATNDTERMRITSGGSVGIGSTPPSNVRLGVFGASATSSDYAFACYTNAGGNLLYIRNDGFAYVAANAWVYGSDLRLKENISDVKSGLDMVLKMKPKHYDYINGTKENIGFIAQDIQEIIPQAVSVTNEETGMLGLKTDFLVPYLVKAIQELSVKVTALENKIN